MYEISYDGGRYGTEDGETVLDTLLRHDVAVPYSCRKGSCLTCLLRLVDGDVSPAAVKNLKPTMVERGLFLACRCEPSGEMTVAAAEDAAVFGRALVTAKEIVTPTVCRLRLLSATPLYYRAGQFVNLRRADGLVRSYSLASVPSLDEELEIHVKRMARGQMSNWVFDDLNIGDGLDLQGPYGSCFYIPQPKDQNLLMIGTGTGLAPLVGILRDALASGHTGRILLYHGSRMADGLYLIDEMKDLAAGHENFEYTPCISGDDAATGFRAGRADAIALADETDLSGWRVFLCGHPAMVNAIRKMAYMAGAALADIMADPFDFQELRIEPRDEPEPLDVW